MAHETGPTVAQSEPLTKGATILVTGATGFIGRRLLAALREKDYEVAILTRDPKRARSRFPQAKWVDDWSLRTGLHPVSMVEQCQAIVHLAGENIVARWDEAKKQAIRQSRLETTQTLVSAIAQAKTKPAVFISASAVGIYGHREEEELTEESAPGDDFWAEVCQAWEQEARAAENYGVRVTCLRIGVVLERDGGLLGRILLPFRCGLGATFDDGQQWMPWIHREDVVGLILHVLERHDVAGPINVTAPVPVRNGEFTRMLGQVLGRRAPLTVSAAVLELLFGEFAGVLLASQCVLPVRAQAIGYAFQYASLEPALRACVSR
ncbi:MAG: TIGR01777 family oxidoreductase [Acidobacteriota bacterium]|nr:TIGR01777 family oxidoreductase [Blastocatellia bacterium]MDW8239296.1 TIGR01777 family oxidoreductase [Acidobacteriota bacterium]